MKRIGIVAVMLAISEPVLASDWQFATISANGAIWYVDVDSVKEVTEGYSQKVVKAWIKIDYRSVKSEPARELKALYFFKCNEEQAKSTTRVKYRADGIVLDTYTPSYANYEPVVPETVLSAAMKLACLKAGY